MERRSLAREMEPVRRRAAEGGRDGGREGGRDGGRRGAPPVLLLVDRRAEERGERDLSGLGLERGEVIVDSTNSVIVGGKDDATPFKDGL